MYSSTPLAHSTFGVSPIAVLNDMKSGTVAEEPADVPEATQVESFDDLIPEEFMLDESEILGISLDNISAFGDSYAEMDFDEETRSSFPEEPVETTLPSHCLHYIS